MSVVFAVGGPSTPLWCAGVGSGGLAHGGWPTRGPHPNLPPAGGRDFWFTSQFIVAGTHPVRPERSRRVGVGLVSGTSTSLRVRGGGERRACPLRMAYPGAPILTFPRRGEGTFGLLHSKRRFRPNACFLCVHLGRAHHGGVDECCHFLTDMPGFCQRRQRSANNPTFSHSRNSN